jgi:two-component system, chemotaxis family, sensor kinase Cph1
MSDSGDSRMQAELERSREALDAHAQQCLELQRQLDLANADFENFISLAAHNLRESLRDVASFSQLIAETSKGSLDSDCGVFLNRVQEGAASAQSLLAGVVDYWAVRAGDRQSSRTDMEAALRLALLSTERQIAERCATVTQDPLPVVTGDSEILSKVLHHLIRNAIEYCGEPSPSVHISSRRVDPDWVFSVRDNGPGIDPAFRNRIFQPFQRLHGREHPGNGLGLAFCKKAIEWYGGRIWMEPAPGTGSNFLFTLPPASK